MNPSHLNLFVVDDDEAVRKSLGMLLVSRGYRVQTFDSGESFLDRADLHNAGCVILDLRMEGMSGLQVFDELRARTSALVVLFLSGHGDIRTAVDATKEGAVEWLEKPCSDDVFLSAVDKALALAAATAAKLPGQREVKARWDSLTPREVQVARLLPTLPVNKLLARELGLDVRTVEAHRAKVYQKLGISNPTELDRLVRDNDL
jgi:FixJ family two-component response regulator